MSSWTIAAGLLVLLFLPRLLQGLPKDTDEDDQPHRRDGSRERRLLRRQPPAWMSQRW